MAFYIYDTRLEIGPGERHDLIGVAAFMFDLQPEYWSLLAQFDPGPHFWNSGTITVRHNEADGLFGYLVYGVSIAHRFGGAFHRSSFVNTTAGVFSVVSDHAQGEAYGFHTGAASPDFTNHGLFTAASRNDAWAVYTWDGGNTVDDWETKGFEFLNTGLISVEAGRNAYGVMMYNGGLARNSGTITVNGAEDAWAMLLWGHECELYNSGLIVATDTVGPDESIGVYISAGIQDSLIVNTGVIRARNAIVEMPLGTPYFPNGLDVVENSGEIYGDITFTFGDDRVLNSGLIVGDVTFVEGRNQFYGARGAMEGVLHMGAGNDWAFGGYSDDRIHGDDGDDDLNGGRGADVIDGGVGRDLLLGGDGDDALSGGADVDVLDGGEGDDVLIAAGGDYLVGGAGNDRMALGAGADRIVLSADDGVDIVEQFDPSEDRFSLGGGLFSGLAVEGTDTRLLHAGGAILVRGLTGLSLSQWNALVEGRSGAAGADGGRLDGSAIADVLVGAAGADGLVGGAGDDWLFGDAGNDDLQGGAGSDVLQTGPGFDRASGGDGDDVITDHAGGVEAAGGDGDDIIFGADADDIMTGGTGGDSLLGGGGRDDLRGDDGADTIYGGDGDDLIHGGSGANALSGDGGDDLILGGVDGELIYGGMGRDRIDGGAGDDLLYGERGEDVIHGGAGNDLINLGDGEDVGFGGEGNDQLRAGGITAVLHGEAGNDALYGLYAGRAWLYGGDGDDTLYTSSNGFGWGGDGNDHIQGIGGVEWFQGGAGDDVIIGGNGHNGRATVDYSDVETFVRVDMRRTDAQDTHGSGRDTIMNVGNLIASGGDDVIDSGYYANHVQGGAGDDLINSQNSDDLLDGGAGADRLDGGEDNDFLVGGAGDDQLIGGTGSDMAWFGGLRAESAFAPDGVATVITGPDGADRLTDIEILIFSDGAYSASGQLLAGSVATSAGADTVTGTGGDNLIYGGGGDDVVTLLSGHHVVFGGDGLDTVAIGVNRQEFTLSRHGETTVIRGLDWIYVLTDVERVAFANQTLILNGNDGQWLAGGAGHDELFGSAGDDELVGNGGEDTLYGYEGDDTLSGGAGNDVIDGGGGFDIVEVAGLRSQYTVLGDGEDFILKGLDGRDHLRSVELIRFSDGETFDLARLVQPEAPVVLPPAPGEPLDKAPTDDPVVLPGTGESPPPSIWPTEAGAPFDFLARPHPGLNPERVGGGWEADGVLF